MSAEIPAQREKPWVMFAAEVRAQAARKRVTQITVAKQMGMSQAALSRRWVGEIPFDLDEICRVAEILDVPVADLISSADIKCNMHGLLAAPAV